MSDLKKQAEELGIEVDGRWNEKRIQSEIDKALGAGNEQSEETVQVTFTDVLLLSDYWPAEGEREKAGTVISLPIEEAKRLIKDKKADRADAFPGER